MTISAYPISAAPLSSSGDLGPTFKVEVATTLLTISTLVRGEIGKVLSVGLNSVSAIVRSTTKGVSANLINQAQTVKSVSKNLVSLFTNSPSITANFSATTIQPIHSSLTLLPSIITLAQKTHQQLLSVGISTYAAVVKVMPKTIATTLSIQTMLTKAFEKVIAVQQQLLTKVNKGLSVTIGAGLLLTTFMNRLKTRGSTLINKIVLEVLFTKRKAFTLTFARVKAISDVLFTKRKSKTVTF